MTHVHVIGFGMGPQHLTAEAVDALHASDYAIAMRKGAHDPLIEVRRRICEAHGLELVELPDPQRDRDDPADYRRAVRDWHAARVDAYAAQLGARSGTVAMLVWGDPALYDSHLRILDQLHERLPLTRDVVAGISAPQLLAARHAIVLHDIGQPVHVTAARRLGDAIDAGQRNVLVMLGSAESLEQLERIGDWQMWWGANLGAAGEQLVAGTVADVLADVRAARSSAQQADGWVMDTYLLRAPAPQASE